MILCFVSHVATKLSFSILSKIKKRCLHFHDSNNKYKKPDDKDSSVSLKPSEHLKHLVNQFSNMSSPPGDINPDDRENIVSSKYYDIEELKNLKIRNKSKSNFAFHINTCSLNKNFDDLQHSLSCANNNFHIILL